MNTTLVFPTASERSPIVNQAATELQLKVRTLLEMAKICALNPAFESFHTIFTTLTHGLEALELSRPSRSSPPQPHLEEMRPRFDDAVRRIVREHGANAGAILERASKLLDEAIDRLRPANLCNYSCTAAEGGSLISFTIPAGWCGWDIVKLTQSELDIDATDARFPSHHHSHAARQAKELGLLERSSEPRAVTFFLPSSKVRRGELEQLAKLEQQGRVPTPARDLYIAGILHRAASGFPESQGTQDAGALFGDVELPSPAACFLGSMGNDLGLIGYQDAQFRALAGLPLVIPSTALSTTGDHESRAGRELLVTLTAKHLPDLYELADRCKRKARSLAPSRFDSDNIDSDRGRALRRLDERALDAGLDALFPTPFSSSRVSDATISHKINLLTARVDELTEGKLASGNARDAHELKVTLTNVLSNLTKQSVRFGFRFAQSDLGPRVDFEIVKGQTLRGVLSQIEPADAVPLFQIDRNPGFTQTGHRTVVLCTGSANLSRESQVRFLESKGLQPAYLELVLFAAGLNIDHHAGQNSTAGRDSSADLLEGRIVRVANGSLVRTHEGYEFKKLGAYPTSADECAAPHIIMAGIPLLQSSHRAA